jgi:glucose-fructose oxidoreductase
MNAKQGKKVRYALIGLGYITQIAMLPAFKAASRNSTIAALISGDRKKLEKLGRDYDAKHLVHYDQFDDLMRSGEIDALYIGLPNTMHREYTVRAARHGVHVLCDKPMAMTVADCRAMIRACDQNSAKLMIAYRLHFEPANLAAFKLLREGAIGELRYFTSEFSQQVKPGNIRTRDDLGGGPLYDMGIYCLNAVRHVFDAEPEEVVAMSAGCDNKRKRFKDVPEMFEATMRFPDDALASFTCSFGASDASSFHVWGTKGSLRLDQAYELKGDKILHVMRAGQQKPTTRVFKATNQFAPLLLHFSECILRNRKPLPSGEEGMADIRALEAIVNAADTGRSVHLDNPKFLGPRLEKASPIKLPPFEPPKLYRAETPSAG